VLISVEIGFIQIMFMVFLHNLESNTCHILVSDFQLLFLYINASMHGPMYGYLIKCTTFDEILIFNLVSMIRELLAFGCGPI